MKVQPESERRGAEAVARQERRAQYERDFNAAPRPDVDMAAEPAEPSYDELHDYSVFQADE